VAAYIGRRLVLTVVVVLGMSVITFVLTHLVPGNPARLLAGPHASQAQVEAFAHRYGLDRPLPVQYWTYISGLVRGDLGVSLTTRRPVLDDFRQFLPATLELVLAAMFLIVVLGIPLGMLSAVKAGSALDHVTRFLTVGAVSMPVFWLGMILQLVFFKRLSLLPVGGRLELLTSPPPHVTGLYLIDSLLSGDLRAFGAAALHLVLPAVTLAAGSLAVTARMTRASMRETLATDYVRMARAKGLSEPVVLTRHALRNALIPTTTVLGLQIGALFGGTVLTEVVFSWPGIGLYAVNAIQNLDYAAIIGVTLLISVAYVLVNLAVDLLYVALDPRIVLAGRSSA
jgi:peptide/nickel transport system permease protein